MKKNNLKVVKIDKNKSLFNYEKKILINELILNLKLGYYDFEKEKCISKGVTIGGDNADVYMPQFINFFKDNLL